VNLFSFEGKSPVVHPGAATGAPCTPLRSIEGTSSELWVETNAVYYRELGARHGAGTMRLHP